MVHGNPYKALLRGVGAATAPKNTKEKHKQNRRIAAKVFRKRYRRDRKVPIKPKAGERQKSSVRAAGGTDNVLLSL